MAAEDELEDDAPGAPPEADSVALRGLAAAGLLRRLELERKQAPAAAQAALRAWLEQNGLFANLGPEGFALFEAAPGSWSAEDHEAVAWAAEELAVLAWALSLRELPPPFERAAAAPLLEVFPGEGPAEPFSLAAKLKPLETVELEQALYDALVVAARTEVWARAIAEDPTLAEGDEDLEALLQEAAEDGFALERLAADQGAAAAAVQGLRHVGQKLLADLFSEGSPHRAAAFAPTRLAGLDEEALALFLATAQLRAQALAWLLEGDDWEDDGP